MSALMEAQADHAQLTAETIDKPDEPAAQEAGAMTFEGVDVLLQMPWWAARGLLYLILACIATALLWARLSYVDIVVQSRGSMVPEGYARPVQSLRNGVVEYVRVREGSRVQRGQMLFQLDTRELRTKADKLREEVATNQEQLRQLMAARATIGETLEKQNRVTRLEEEIAAVDIALGQTIVSAPISGTLTTLDVHSPGAVVRAGQQLAAIAPTQARMIVEAQVSNKDMTFIEKGMPAKLKFDAFPFQDYGSVPGTIIDVATDARTKEQQASFYKVMIAPEQAGITARGKMTPFRPGLALTAEIITERKTILALLLEPFRKLKANMAGVTS